MYSSFQIATLALVAVACLVTSSQAFMPIQCPTRSAASTAAFMVEKKGKKDDIPSFLKGRGARITIRQDEDNAMWVEEPKKKEAPKPKGKAAPAKKTEEKKGGFKFPW